jgi:CDP-2,3-bis-(O-geranylgeranyl)-sn-glycerol synthase
MVMDLLYEIIIYPIIYIWPAYVANGAPVIFGRGRRLPMDFNKKWWDGRPILGKHKTWLGFIGGILSGFLMAVLESFFIPSMLVIGIASVLGAHFGDLLGSFIKRRLGTAPGRSHWLMDAYLFLFFAFAFAYPFGNLPTIGGIIFLVVLTGVLHRVTNIIAHKSKIKDVPW